MTTSVKCLPHSSKWIAVGIIALLCTFPGNLFSDDKKPAPKAATASPAAAPDKTAPAAPAKPAVVAPSGGAASHTPGVSHGPGVGTTRPTTPNPAGAVSRPGGTGGAPTRPTGVGGAATHPTDVGGTPSRPVGGREFGGSARQPGSARTPVIHGEHAVYRGPNNRVSAERRLTDGRLVHADGRGRGYIHSEYAYGGHRVYQRVYYVNGRPYPRYYSPYFYHGVEISVYAPPRYYAAGFYGWAYNPWAVPVVYSWGFAATPWYGYYRGYFSPYPSYASPALWLTDYVIANNLEQAYQAQRETQQQMQPQQADAPMPPDVKQQIAEEVKRQIALENNERQTAENGLPDPASSGVARMFQDNTTHVFVVAAPLNVDSLAGQCPVTEGDVLQLTPSQGPGADGLANVVVLASKGQDCQRGSTIMVGVADLQDMQNAMRQTIDQGMGTLQQNQGKGGLPPIPASANAPPVDTAFAKIGPPPPSDGAQQISQEWNAGTKAEQTLVNDAASGPANMGAPQQAEAVLQPEPAQLGPGMTVAEVEASQGKPTTILAPSVHKKTYIYKNFKVTFTDGKVTDIQ